MADGNNFAPKRIKNALDDRKLTLSVPVPNEKQNSTLLWGIYKNNPRVTVWTGFAEDKNNEYGKIQGEMDMIIFASIILQIREMAKTTTANGTKVKVNLKNYIWPQGKRSETPIAKTEVWVGKDDEGVVFMSVIDRAGRNRPKIKFPFINGLWHNWEHGDGTPFSKAQASALQAEAYCKVLEQMMVIVMEKNWVEPEKKDAGGGGGGNFNRGGGNNYRGNGGGGGSSSMDDISSADMPF